MIFGFSTKKVWEKHRSEFLQLYTRELVKKIGAKDLEHRYTDQNGVAYFGFPKDMSLPVDRLGKLYFFSELLHKGLSVSEDRAIHDAMGRALEEGLQNKKTNAAVRIGGLLSELEKRRQLVFHTELIINLLAVQWVREDEDPCVYSNEIQMQKVDQFKLEIEKVGSYPFFQVPELIQLNSFFRLSKDEWDQFWKESQIQQEVLKQALQIVYSSASGSEKSKTTSKAA